MREYRESLKILKKGAKEYEQFMQGLGSKQRRQYQKNKPLEKYFSTTI